MIGILAWILTGLLVGFAARLILPGRQPIGILMTCLVGIGGAFVGGLISTAIWGMPASDPAQIETRQMWPGWIMSIVGAVLVLLAYMKLIGTRVETDLETRRQVH